MVVVSPVHEDTANLEEVTQLLQAADASHPLCHGKSVSNLITGLVAFPARPVRLPDEADGEASLSVYKTDHPATLLDQSFLLIVRTRHVVTIVNVQPDGTMSSAGYFGVSSI
jgi:hypothetical protein